MLSTASSDSALKLVLALAFPLAPPIARPPPPSARPITSLGLSPIAVVATRAVGVATLLPAPWVGLVLVEAPVSRP
uniref:Putative secreted protein n=1 Tax=Panstrongylus lignarius TaxID=156445 RepID=A0A224Y0B6_9HEMI